MGEKPWPQGMRVPISLLRPSEHLGFFFCMTGSVPPTSGAPSICGVKGSEDVGVWRTWCSHLAPDFQPLPDTQGSVSNGCSSAQ